MSLKRTALFELHQSANGKMVPFSGWEMPIHYGSQVEEHHAVRQSVGMFDVSHMTIVDLEGADAESFLQVLVANDIAKLSKEGDALYTPMLNDRGGIIDDLIIYKMGFGYRLVVNCATREGDLAWIEQTKTGRSYNNVTVKERDDLSIIALQGPKAMDIAESVLGGEAGSMLKRVDRFKGLVFNQWFLGRTGYTGEDGLEVMLPHEDAVVLWKQLIEKGVPPCGLGARDTLRLEAGMNLYGNDMTTEVTPLESNIGWTVDWKDQSRQFIGREALQAQRDQGVPRKLVGLVMKGRGVMRAEQKIIVAEEEVGVTTSGGFSPTLGVSIAFARIKSEFAKPSSDGESGLSVAVEIRGKLQPVEIVKPPFYKQ